MGGAAIPVTVLAVQSGLVLPTKVVGKSGPDWLTGAYHTWADVHQSGLTILSIWHRCQIRTQKYDPTGQLQLNIRKQKIQVVYHSVENKEA